MDRIKLEITQEMIDFAVPRDSSHCMFAEAIKVAIPDATHISVDTQTIRLTRPKYGKRYIYLTPRVAQLAIIQWDMGQKPEPFEAVIRQPQTTFAGSRQATAELMKAAGLSNPKQLTEDHKQKIKDGIAKANRTKKKLIANVSGTVPRVEGGEPPPLAKTKDNVPFARRRAFGLRALDL